MPRVKHRIRKRVTYDACEAFSPHRVTEMARQKGMEGGWSLDFKVEDPILGRQCDFRVLQDQATAREILHRDKPRVLIVCPPCTLMSQANTKENQETNSYAKSLRRSDLQWSFLRFRRELEEVLYSSILWPRRHESCRVGWNSYYFIN